MNCKPLKLLTLALIYLLQLVYSNFSIEGAGGYDGAKLGTSPFDLPRCCPIDHHGFLLGPFVSLLGEGSNSLVTADSGETSASPIKAHIVDDDVGRQFSKYIYTSLLIHSNKWWLLYLISTYDKMQVMVTIPLTWSKWFDFQCLIHLIKDYTHTSQVILWDRTIGSAGLEDGN